MRPPGDDPRADKDWTEADEREFRRTHPRPPTSADEELLEADTPAIVSQLDDVARVPSIGLDIELPHEQFANEFADLGMDFHYFFARKVMFVRYASAFVVFPGGFGTLDELFEAATLRQTGKIRHFPIVLFGSEYWTGLVEWLREQVVGRGNIAEADVESLIVTDSVDAVVAIVQAAEHRRPRAAA